MRYLPLCIGLRNPKPVPMQPWKDTYRSARARSHYCFFGSARRAVFSARHLGTRRDQEYMDLICPHTLTFRTSLIARPITNEIAAIPKLIASISRKRDLKGRSFATAR